MRRHLIVTILGALAVTTAAVALPGSPIAGEPAPEAAASTGPEADAASVGDGVELPWELLDCEFAVAFVLADTAELQAMAPDGFTVRSPTRGPTGVSTPADRSLVGVEAETCEEGTSVAGLVDGVDYASIWVAVQPPEDLVVTGFEGGYYVNFDPLVPDEERRGLFDDVGVPAHGGEVAFETNPATGVFEATWNLDGLGDLSVEANTVEDPIGTPGGSFVQWTEASDGDLAQWRIDWQMHTFFQGPGIVHVPPGSWLADLLGSETVPAPIVYYGTWDYTDGEIQLPS